MLKNREFIFFALLAVGCGHQEEKVFVNLDHLLVVSDQKERQEILPVPPKPLPARTYSLPEIPAKALEDSSSPEMRKTQEDAAKSQQAAVTKIRNRLREIYLKQVDLFGRQQLELLGDPDARRVEELLPKLHAAFLVYADKRLPLSSRFSFLVGQPDGVLKNLPAVGPLGPEPADLKPVQKQRWEEAVQLRIGLSQLDADYDREATTILAGARVLADADRNELARKIEDYRASMMERANTEAASPLRTSKNLKVLRVEAAPKIVLPREEAQSLQIPATATLPNAPQVEFERLSGNRDLSRQLLLRQLKIWSSINDYQTVNEPQKRVRDATQEFEQWRNQQEVGP